MRNGTTPMPVASTSEPYIPSTPRSLNTREARQGRVNFRECNTNCCYHEAIGVGTNSGAMGPGTSAPQLDHRFLLLMRERVERRVLSLMPMMRRMSSSLLPSCSRMAKKMSECRCVSSLSSKELKFPPNLYITAN